MIHTVFRFLSNQTHMEIKQRNKKQLCFSRNCGRIVVRIFWFDWYLSKLCFGFCFFFLYSVFQILTDVLLFFKLRLIMEKIYHRSKFS